MSIGKLPYQTKMPDSSNERSSALPHHTRNTIVDPALAAYFGEMRNHIPATPFDDVYMLLSPYPQRQHSSRESANIYQNTDPDTLHFQQSVAASLIIPHGYFDTLEHLKPPMVEDWIRYSMTRLVSLKSGPAQLGLNMIPAFSNDRYNPLPVTQTDEGYTVPVTIQNWNPHYPIQLPDPTTRLPFARFFTTPMLTIYGNKLIEIGKNSGAPVFYVGDKHGNLWEYDQNDGDSKNHKSPPKEVLRKLKYLFLPAEQTAVFEKCQQPFELAALASVSARNRALLDQHLRVNLTPQNPYVLQPGIQLYQTAPIGFGDHVGVVVPNHPAYGQVFHGTSVYFDRNFGANPRQPARGELINFLNYCIQSYTINPVNRSESEALQNRINNAHPLLLAFQFYN